jgi:hypothetical protein
MSFFAHVYTLHTYILINKAVCKQTKYKCDESRLHTHLDELFDGQLLIELEPQSLELSILLTPDKIFIL